ncbi:MAG: hypothetical protein Q8O39_02455 [bacterium]|nr:hypothetical protein [bacterium]
MINLIPEEEKIILEEERGSKIKNLFLIFIFFCLLSIFLCSLTFYFYYLGEKEGKEIELKTLQQEIGYLEKSSLTKERTRVEKEIDIFEKNLKNKKAFYSDILKPISLLIPQNIYFKELTISLPKTYSKKETTSRKEGLSARINGYAANRTVLLELKENLSKAPWINNFYFPPSNWINDRDIDFYLTFDIP